MLTKSTTPTPPGAPAKHVWGDLLPRAAHVPTTKFIPGVQAGPVGRSVLAQGSEKKTAAANASTANRPWEGPRGPRGRVTFRLLEGGRESAITRKLGTELEPVSASPTRFRLTALGRVPPAPAGIIRKAMGGLLAPRHEEEEGYE